ncbi:DNA adenine methylase [Acetobacter orientalis]|uniref:DNA adenine methylase n=1 Tax=Acetobacter orientalis TaxID=146474 RepID=UPI0020A48AB6|nr:DNA adenine methylase [Acetobacter orientalis]MCP1222368.1 DNA adenine methylase [Acetobacter orientalis]
MRYLGSKRKHLPQIEKFLLQKTDHKNIKTFLDLFSGTGAVGFHFKPYYSVTANDILSFCTAVCCAKLSFNTPPEFKGLKDLGDPINYLNSLRVNVEATHEEKNFITNNYTLSASTPRKFFTEENAIKIDMIRQSIELWYVNNFITEPEYKYLVGCLIMAVSKVSNTAGIYAAFLKHWDNRALKPIELHHPILINNNKSNSVHNNDALCAFKQLPNYDLCYIDPPYNNRHYTSNYHLLETIARYDYPHISGISGSRSFTSNEKSLFCSKAFAYEAFDRLINCATSKRILVSYSSNGILQKDEISDILKKYGRPKTFKFEEINAEPYKSKEITKKPLKEYLFFVEMR